jgi:AbiV family abortive infection protein
MGFPSAQQVRDGALAAVDNAAQILGAAERAASQAPTVGAFLTAVAREEIGKAKLLLEHLDSGRTGEALPEASWSTLSRQLRTGHRAKLRACARWERELHLGPDPCDYCDLAEPDCPECRATDSAEREHVDTSDYERQLALSCLYVDWDSSDGSWSTPLPLAGSSTSRRYLLGVIDAFRDDVLARTRETEDSR